MPDDGEHVRPMAELAALGSLFQEHRARLLGMIRRRISPALARRVEPEEILNNVYLKLHQRWPEITALQEPPSRFLYRAARDCLNDAWRFHKRKNRDVEREVPWPERASQVLGSKLAAALTSPSQALSRKELAASIRSAIDGLDPIDREIIELRYLDQMNYAEIAELLGITRDTAMKRHSRALRRLELDHSDFNAGPGDSP